MDQTPLKVEETSSISNPTRNHIWFRYGSWGLVAVVAIFTAAVVVRPNWFVPTYDAVNPNIPHELKPSDVYYTSIAPLGKNECARATGDYIYDSGCEIYHTALASGKIANPDTLVALYQGNSEAYLKDSDKVYFYTYTSNEADGQAQMLIVLADADPSRFMPIQDQTKGYSGYGSDGVHMYANGVVVPEADMATFKVLYYQFAYDTNAVYRRDIRTPITPNERKLAEAYWNKELPFLPLESSPSKSVHLRRVKELPVSYDEAGYEPVLFSLINDTGVTVGQVLIDAYTVLQVRSTPVANVFRFINSSWDSSFFDIDVALGRVVLRTAINPCADQSYISDQNNGGFFIVSNYINTPECGSGKQGTVSYQAQAQATSTVIFTVPTNMRVYGIFPSYARPGSVIISYAPDYYADPTELVDTSLSTVEIDQNGTVTKLFGAKDQYSAVPVLATQSGKLLGYKFPKEGSYYATVPMYVPGNPGKWVDTPIVTDNPMSLRFSPSGRYIAYGAPLDGAFNGCTEDMSDPERPNNVINIYDSAAEKIIPFQIGAATTNYRIRGWSSDGTELHFEEWAISPTRTTEVYLDNNSTSTRKCWDEDTQEFVREVAKPIGER